jgi:hypothetical protein
LSNLKGDRRRTGVAAADTHTHASAQRNGVATHQATLKE